MPIETIPALLARNAIDFGTRDAIICHNARVDYATLDRLSAARAAWFVEKGVNKGHRVGLLMPNGVDWAINAYAIMRIGAVLVPLSTFLRPRELEAQLTVAGIRHLIAVPSFLNRDYATELAAIDRSSLPSLRNLWWTTTLGDQAAPVDGVAQALAGLVTPADDMVVIFTSGSSGLPKGVIYTHGAAIRATAAGLADRCIRPETRLYLPMPFFWVGGFSGGLISALIAGATLLTEAEPRPDRTLAFLAREKATLFRGWPDQAVRIASHADFTVTDLSSLRPGSLDALLPAKYQSQPGRRANLFGMTETFGPFCGYPLDADMAPTQSGSCGRPFAGMRVRIVDPKRGKTLPPGEMGHIQVGGKNILRGICGVERERVFTQDGWYDAGDLGRLDDQGFLYFAGRSDDMLKIKGTSVWPSEVERALASIPGVARAAVTGITTNNQIEIGALIVTDNPDAADEERLIRAAKERLSTFKVPTRWTITTSEEDIPLTASGKLDRRALRAIFEHQE